MVTTVGDASFLEDKKIAITFNSDTRTDVWLESNLLVTFKDGPVAEDVVQGIVTKAHTKISNFYLSSDHEGTNFSLEFSWNNQLSHTWQPFPSGSLIVEGIPWGSNHYHIDVRTIEIGEIYYFTIENPSLDSKHTGDPDGDDWVIIDYTAQSGIWAYYEVPSDDPNSRAEGHLENVVPYTVTGPSGASEVYGLYATEDETALVLITVENGTDLYATFYDIQTKTAGAPRLVYHCENGRIRPQILDVNSTCPLGSILLKIESDDENNPITYHALGLLENEVTGDIQIIDYPMDNFNWDILYTNNDYEYHRIVGADNKGKKNGSSDIYYVGDELWVVSYEHRKRDVHYGNGEAFVVTANKIFEAYRRIDSDPADIIFHGQLIQEFLIQGYRGNALFYEGVLSVDLTITNPELRFDGDKHFPGDDNTYGYLHLNDVSAQVTLLYE